MRLRMPMNERPVLGSGKGGLNVYFWVVSSATMVGACELAASWANCLGTAARCAADLLSCSVQRRKRRELNDARNRFPHSSAGRARPVAAGSRLSRTDSPHGAGLPAKTAQIYERIRAFEYDQPPKFSAPLVVSERVHGAE